MNVDLIEALPNPVLQIGSDNRVLAANAGARRVFGTAPVGRHYITLIRQPDLLDAVERAIERGERAEAAFLTTEARRDMTWFATVTPLGQGAERTVVVALEDRTAMEEAGQIRRDFVANVSHELRTPLTAMTGFIETLQGAARDDPAARDRFLTIMEREAGRMNRLVDDLLSLSRVEADARVRPSGLVDLSAITRAVIGALTPLAEDAGKTITGAGTDAPLQIRGDGDQLSQVVTNLLENAIKYSRAASAIDVKLSQHDLHPLTRAPSAVLEVSDQGDGIGPEHIARLTERFYRVDAHRSREMGGTGLGLAIVKHIVNRHRGRLRINSEKGEGSTFSVILPLDDPASPTGS